MVRTADGGGGGGSEIHFPPYNPTPGEISADASALSDTAGSTESVADTVAGRHNAAVDGVSGMVQSAMQGQDAQAKAMAVKVARRAISGGAALKGFSTHVSEHDTKVAHWNRLIAAEDDDEKKRKKYNQLRPHWQESLEDLQTGGKAQDTARYLRRPLDVDTVRALFRAGAMPGATPSIFPGAKLSGKDQLKAVEARVRNGDLPELADLSEEERLQLLEENPQLLPWLMGKDDPTDDQMTIVRDLAVPHLDGEDGDAAGQDVLDALDEKATPEEFARALGMVGGFGAYAKWAQEHGGPAIPSNRMDFLRNFYGKTGDKIDDIQDYIADDEHRYKTGETTGYNPYTGNYTNSTYDTVDGFPKSQQEAGLKDLANGLLTLSDHRLGGGWDELPEDVQNAVKERPDYTYAAGNVAGVDWNDDFEDIAGLLADGDVAPGDGMAKELAQTASTTLGYTDGTFGRGHEDTGSRDALEIVGRNHHATSEILSGQDMPEGYDNTRFLENVYGHDWSDDGAAAAGLTDWVDEGLRDPDQWADADRAWNGVVDGVTSAGPGGAFRELMTGEDEPAMQRNPEIAHSLFEMTVPRLDTFAENHPDDAPITDRDQMRMMMLLSSEPDTADALSGAVHLEQQKLVEGIADSDFSSAEETGQKIATIQSKFDAGVFNAARAADMSDAEAEAQRLAVLKTGISLAGTVNPGAAVAGNLLNNSLSAPNSSFNDVDVPGGWERDDQTDLMRARINNEILHARGGDVGDVATDPMNLASDLDDIRNGLIDTDIDRDNWDTFDEALGDEYQNNYSEMGPRISIDDVMER